MFVFLSKRSDLNLECVEMFHVLRKKKNICLHTQHIKMWKCSVDGDVWLEIPHFVLQLFLSFHFLNYYFIIILMLKFCFCIFFPAVTSTRAAVRPVAPVTAPHLCALIEPTTISRKAWWSICLKNNIITVGNNIGKQYDY